MQKIKLTAILAATVLVAGMILTNPILVGAGEGGEPFVLVCPPGKVVTAIVLEEEPDVDGVDGEEVVDIDCDSLIEGPQGEQGPQGPQGPAGPSSDEICGDGIDNDNDGNVDEAEAYPKGFSNLAGCDLSFANLSGANLFQADLSGADLSQTDLSGANLFEADLSGADLRFADLSGAIIQNADLSGADFRFTDLTGASLTGGGLDVTNTNFDGASLGAAIGGPYIGCINHPLCV